jgi:hypothetical protein
MLTKETILAGTVDVNAIKIKDLREFVKESGITCPIKNGMNVVDGLNKICAVLDPDGETQPAPTIPEPVPPTGDDESKEFADTPGSLDTSDTEETAPTPEKPNAAPPAEKKTGFRARRQAKIDAEVAAVGSGGQGGQGIDPAAYGGDESVPEFLKRRMRGEA